MAHPLRSSLLILLSIFSLSNTTLLFSQTSSKGTIKGKITDEKTSEALPNANVSIKGTYLGAVSDFDGNFSIPGVNAGSYTVDISLLGYKTVQYTALKVTTGEIKILEVKLEETVLSLGQEVVIIGEKPLFNLEEVQSTHSVNSADIKASAVKSVQEVVAMQTGVVQADNEIHIRGGRTYENAYLVDGISVQDPLGGTGFGLQLSPSAIQEVEVITGGYNAEYGQATSGVVNITTKEGAKNYSGSFSYKRDHFGMSNNFHNSSSSFLPFLNPLLNALNNSGDSRSNTNTDIYEASLSGPLLPMINGKSFTDISFFGTFYANLSDEFTRWAEIIGANGIPIGYGVTPTPQLHSSLYSTNFLSPRRANSWSWLGKLTWRPTSVMKLSYAYSTSISIDQNTKSFQATLERVEPRPGYQYRFQNIPDSANTFTQRNIQHSVAWTHTLSPKAFYELKFSRYTAHVRADANGKYFDQYNEPKDIITFPISYYNLSTDTIGIIPGDGFYDVGNASRWRDHSIIEYTLKGDLTNNFTEKHKFKAGFEARLQDMQMVDIVSPWYKPLGLDNDIYTVNPALGAFYAQDNLTLKGMILNVGLRLDYWFPGNYVDETIQLPSNKTNISPSVRDAYLNETLDMFGKRMKARLSPRIGISHPVSDNQTLFFSYGHFSKLPRPQFVYSKLAKSASRATSQTIGNPNLNPETTVSYELGLRNQLSGSDVLTITAYYKDIFDYISARTLRAPGSRFASGTFTTYINLDYSRIRGLEVEYKTRLGSWFRGTLSGSYSIATGKSSSADEALYNLQSGLEENIKELPMIFDRPLQLSANLNFTSKKNQPLFGIGKGILDDYNFFMRIFYESGKRYTRQIFVGKDPTSGRPYYVPDVLHPNTELGDPWFYVDLNFEKYFNIGIGSLSLTLEVQNLFDRKNSQVINPVTGRAYQYPDPTQYPTPAVNDPRYPDLTYPVDTFPYDPSRYLNPRIYKLGVAFTF